MSLCSRLKENPGKHLQSIDSSPSVDIRCLFVSLSCLPYLLLYLPKISSFSFPVLSSSLHAFSFKGIFYHAIDALCTKHAQFSNSFQSFIPNRMSNITDSWIAIKCKILLFLSSENFSLLLYLVKFWTFFILGDLFDFFLFIYERKILC